MYFRNYRLRKTWLDQCQKICVSEDPSTDNMTNGSKQCRNLNEAPLKYLLITVKVVVLGKISFSDMQNPMAVC